MGKDYKIVLVIGNGFDLDLGLKTRYSDFMESDFFLNELSDKNFNNEVWRRYNEYELSLFDYLNSLREIKNWIDLEVELAYWASRKVYRPNTKEWINCRVTQLEEKTFWKLHEALCAYMESIDYEKIKTDSYAFTLLKLVMKYKMSEILSFNYTDLHKLEPFLGEISIPIDNIHGLIIILGFQDDVVIDNSYSFMIKSFSSHFRSHNVREKLLDADEVIFFGHSLGITDYHYFEDLFKRQSQGEKAKKIILRIFSYDEKSRRDILIQLHAMNNKRTDMLYDLCDFEIYRTKAGIDGDKISRYLKHLSSMIKLSSFFDYKDPEEEKIGKEVQDFYNDIINSNDE